MSNKFYIRQSDESELDVQLTSNANPIAFRVTEAGQDSAMVNLSIKDVDSLISFLERLVKSAKAHGIKA